MHRTALILACASSALAFCGRHTHAERALAGQTFDYGSAGGPLIWANLDPEAFATCKEGTRQAPTNVLSASTDTINDLVLDIPVVNAPTRFENIGTTVEVVLNGTLTQGGVARTLKQMHFHTPSEHRINDEYFVAESHFVHESAEDGAITVLSVLYTLEAEVETPAISEILKTVNTITEPGSETEVEGLDFGPFISEFVTGAEFFSLDQSLTTPPCTEGVQWFIRTEPVPLSVTLFNSLKSTVKFNSRPTQNTLGQENLLAVAAAGQPIDFQAASGGEPQAQKEEPEEEPEEQQEEVETQIDENEDVEQLEDINSKEAATSSTEDGATSTSANNEEVIPTGEANFNVGGGNQQELEGLDRLGAAADLKNLNFGSFGNFATPGKRMIKRHRALH